MRGAFGNLGGRKVATQDFHKKGIAANCFWVGGVNCKANIIRQCFERSLEDTFFLQKFSQRLRQRSRSSSVDSKHEGQKGNGKQEFPEKRSRIHR